MKLFQAWRWLWAWTALRWGSILATDREISGRISSKVKTGSQILKGIYYFQWAERVTLASDLHRGQISTSSRKEWGRNSTCWNSCPHVEHVSVIHKGAVTVNLIELRFIWGQVRHSGFATFFSWINCMTGLFKFSVMFLFIKVTLISTFPGSFFSSTFQRNSHVSQFVSIESFTGHAVWVWSRNPSVHPIYQRLIHGFPKLCPTEHLKTAEPLYVAHKRIS